MKIILDRDKPVSLTRQIRTHFEHLVRAGLLVPGMKLPATRQLATELGINRATAVTAYEDLVASGDLLQAAHGALQDAGHADRLLFHDEVARFDL